MSGSGRRLPPDPYKAFKRTCTHGSMNDLITHSKRLEIDMHYNECEVFRITCMYGRLENAKLLYELGAKIHAKNDEALRLACLAGHLPVVLWLCEKGANIHTKNDVAFRLACSRGKFRVARWLHSKGANIHAEDDAGIMYACVQGYLNMAKWLWDLRCIQSISKLEEIIELTKDTEHHEVVEWLESLR